jgi:hypothetical protein
VRVRIDLSNLVFASVRLAEPDGGVSRELTSFELIAGDEDVGADGKLDRVGTEVDDAGESLAALEGED